MKSADPRSPFWAVQTSSRMKITLTKKNRGRISTEKVDIGCEPLDKLFSPADRTLIKIDIEGLKYHIILVPSGLWLEPRACSRNCMVRATWNAGSIPFTCFSWLSLSILSALGTLCSRLGI
jgi:hypothetical protein